MLIILGAIATALVVGTVIYLAVKLTVSVLKQFKKKKNSKLLAAQVKDLLKTAPTMSLDDLDEDDVILAEYDLAEDDLVQDVTISNDVDEKVAGILKQNGGMVVFD